MFIACSTCKRLLPDLYLYDIKWQQLQTTVGLLLWRCAQEYLSCQFENQKSKWTCLGLKKILAIFSNLKNDAPYDQTLQSNKKFYRWFCFKGNFPFVLSKAFQSPDFFSQFFWIKKFNKLSKYDYYYYILLQICCTLYFRDILWAIVRCCQRIFKSFSSHQKML